MEGTGLRRKVIACSLLALIPVSVLAGFLVLLAMAGGAASATGGCGGG